MPGYYHRITLSIPAQVSCLSCVEPRQLLVGSGAAESNSPRLSPEVQAWHADDGSVRLYDLDTFKVLKAIRGLHSPVSSVALQPRSPVAFLWVASGRQVLRFSLETDSLILTSSDVLQTLDIGIDDDDNLGELSINVKGTKMAFCTDSGSVGVVDLQTNEITRMKQSHDNICGSVQFIPGRPSELVSGGYDHAMLHFDFVQGNVLSRDDLSAAPPSSGVSLSPPFILCLSISPAGIIAAGTADGRLYIGTGGEKRPNSAGDRQKRQRRWKGLDKDGRVIADVAEGPIVALAFSKPRELLMCTLLGRVTQYHICGSAASGTLKLELQSRFDSQDNHKVNSIALSRESSIIGGFRKDGTGVIEVWSTLEGGVPQSRCQAE